MPFAKKYSSSAGIALSRDKDERNILENQWVEAISRGDKDAFQDAYKCYYPRLFYFLKRYLRSEYIIEDIIHNVFYKVWEHRQSLKPTGTFKSYLFTAVRNQALKQLEEQKREENHTEDSAGIAAEDGGNPDYEYAYRELEKAYLDAVSRLPGKRRKIFLMHRQDQLTYREIADILQISVKTVEIQIGLSLKFLAVRLSEFR